LPKTNCHIPFCLVAMKSVQLAMLGFTVAQAGHTAPAAAPTPATPKCSSGGEDCTLTGCCMGQGMKCFRKNEHWSACNATCAPKKIWKDDKWQDANTKTWECEVMLPHQVATATAPACKDPKKSGEDCSTTGCCEKPGEICFRKDEHHSSCNVTCNPYAKWNVSAWITTDNTVWDCTVVKPTHADSVEEERVRRK